MGYFPEPLPATEGVVRRGIDLTMPNVGPRIADQSARAYVARTQRMQFWPMKGGSVAEKIPICRHFREALSGTRTLDPLLTMEVLYH